MAQVESNMTDAHPEEAAEQVDDSMALLLQKLQEVQKISTWLNKTGKAIIRKHTTKTRRRSASGQKSGFAVPVKVDPELANFLKIDASENIPRTEVTKLLTKYIKENNLQCENKKLFICDEPLAKVFKIPKGTQTNWFEMQKFLAKLLTSVKKDSAGDADAPAADAPAAEAPVVDKANPEKKKKLKK